MALDIETVSTIAAKFANDVRSVLPVNKVVLYGSYVKGTATDLSDVDICFFVSNLDDSNWLNIMRQLRRISRNYLELYISPIAFHVSDLDADNPFVKEVLRTGIEIQ
jgi:predicted nucleotidyltransferase